MFCSKCGTQLGPGQSFCPQCGQPLAPPAPAVPEMHFPLESYRNKVRILSIVWFVYAGITLLLGFAGLSFARAMFFNGRFGPWMNHPMPQGWMPFFQLAWMAISVRALLGVIAGWGLLEHTNWGRVVAIIAAFLSLLQIPLGTALGIWTLIVLLGYRNSMLYQQL